jgi:hypothetical protein
MSDYDFVAGMPLDKAAGTVVRKGTHFEPYIKPGDTLTWDINPMANNIRGMRRGRMVIVDYYGSRKKRDYLLDTKIDRRNIPLITLVKEGICGKNSYGFWRNGLPSFWGR